MFLVPRLAISSVRVEYPNQNLEPNSDHKELVIYQIRLPNSPQARHLAVNDLWNGLLSMLQSSLLSLSRYPQAPAKLPAELHCGV